MIDGLTNHLWQSTLFAVAAGLLAIACRKNRAQIRYWLWLSATLKFLVPFSLLMSLGSHLAWVPTSEKIATQAVSFAVVQITQPFSDSLSFATSTPRTTQWIPIALLGLWVCGFGVITLARFKVWLRIRAAVRSSTPLNMPANVEVRSSPGLLEPGVVGLLRPILLLPDGITERLTKPQLEAVLTHEQCHIKRRDNLTASIHMIVEAVFWFHPLVWWVGARLVEERERACDEDVLRLGIEPQVYAEGILKVCKFYVESPLSCVAGVTGNNLKKRMELIMRNHIGETLNIWRKLLLATAGMVAIAAPIAFGLLHATPSRAASQMQNTGTGAPVYQVASIKPNETGTASLKTGKGIITQNMMFTPGTFTAQNTSLQELIRVAYGVDDYQVSGAPDWFSSELYDVDAKAEKSAIDTMQKLDKDQRDLEDQRMLQALLTDRFKLTLHRETKELPVYSLVVAEPGQLHEAPGDCGPHPNPVMVKADAPPPPPPCGNIRVAFWVGRLDGQKVPIKELITKLSGFTRRMVLDKTNLVGKYDIDLKWFPDPSEFPPRPAYLPPSYQPDPNSPPLLTAIQQQLGLKLESQTGPVPLFIIDHAEKPSEN
jgi:bla regulator protein blaR1